MRNKGSGILSIRDAVMQQCEGWLSVFLDCQGKVCWVAFQGLQRGAQDLRSYLQW